MRKLRKLLALALTAAMVLSMGVMASAENEGEMAERETQDTTIV